MFELPPPTGFPSQHDHLFEYRRSQSDSECIRPKWRVSNRARADASFLRIGSKHEFMNTYVVLAQKAGHHTSRLRQNKVAMINDNGSVIQFNFSLNYVLTRLALLHGLWHNTFHQLGIPWVGPDEKSTIDRSMLYDIHPDTCPKSRRCFTTCWSCSTAMWNHGR